MRGERNYLNDKAFKEKMTNEERTMMEENMGLVLTVNQKFYNYDKDTIIDDDDMIQVGRLYLLKAIRSYNPEKSKFSTYAYRILFNGMYSYIKNFQGRLNSTTSGIYMNAIPFSELTIESDDSNNITLFEETIEDYSIPDINEHSINAERIRVINNFINKQPENQRKMLIMKLYYDMSYPEIAEKLNMNKNYIGEIIRKKIKSLRHSLCLRGLK